MSEDDIRDFTKRTGLTIFEASAKTGHAVESSFIALTDALIDQAVEKAKGNWITRPSENHEEKPFEDGKIKMKHINGRGGLT